MFDNHLNVLKEDISVMVAPLMVNNTQLEIREGDQSVKHLLSVHVEKKDYPWAVVGEVGGDVEMDGDVDTESD